MAPGKGFPKVCDTDKFGVPGCFGPFRCSVVFRGVPGCSDVPWCSGVPVFLLLVHAASLIIILKFHSASLATKTLFLAHV